MTTQYQVQMMNKQTGELVETITRTPIFFKYNMKLNYNGVQLVIHVTHEEDGTYTYYSYI